MKGDKRDDRGAEPADDTAPGLRMIRELWDIPKSKPEQEKAPTSVVTNIYAVPDHKKNIPRRSHRHHGHGS